MNIHELLADPTRRRLIEVLGQGERSADELGAVALAEFGLSQPATSRHLRVLRESGLVRSRVAGARRLYALEPAGLRDLDAWLDQFRGLWTGALSALGTEIERGRRAPDEDTATRGETA